jgi:hypothetical protein
VAKVPLLLVVSVVAALAAWVLATRATPPAVIQPIAFNHQKHLAVGLTCDSCHQYYEQHAVAGLPRTELCMGCHAAPLTESPEEEKVRSYGERGHEIPWIKIHVLPDHSFFSHRRHVALGKLDCVVCHGDMARRTTPVTAPAVKLTMDWCVGCHTRRHVTSDCNACHR